MGARRSAGFTLVETLVALAIFALVGAAAWQVLSSVMRADERLTLRADELRQLNRTLNQLQQDLEHLVRRPVRVGAASEPWLLVDPDAEQPLRLTRAGRLNPLQLPRSELQRVAYRVARHPDHEQPDSRWYGDQRTHLQRLSWVALDRPAEQQPLVQVLLEEVDSVAFVVVGPRGRSARWPLPPEGATTPSEQRDTEPLAEAPRAVAVELEHSRLGTLHRLIRLF